ncbi:hypothetical protein [Brucella intermedia]|uniref:hypothetical protein n=1 Tax=Brucella intermedia TaxID=94625 RepID=UPI00178C643E|nr:hypothetical protein [Brucella intermedia]
MSDARGERHPLASPPLTLRCPFAYCGVTDVESHLIYDVEGDHNASKRTEGLAQVREIANTFLSPARAVRNVKDDYLRARSSLHYELVP